MSVHLSVNQPLMSRSDNGKEDDQDDRQTLRRGMISGHEGESRDNNQRGNPKGTGQAIEPTRFVWSTAEGFQMGEVSQAMPANKVVTKGKEGVSDRKEAE